MVAVKEIAQIDVGGHALHRALWMKLSEEASSGNLGIVHDGRQRCRWVHRKPVQQFLAKSLQGVPDMGRIRYMAEGVARA